MRPFQWNMELFATEGGSGERQEVKVGLPACPSSSQPGARYDEFDRCGANAGFTTPGCVRDRLEALAYRMDPAEGVVLVEQRILPIRPLWAFNLILDS